MSYLKSLNIVVAITVYFVFFSFLSKAEEVFWIVDSNGYWNDASNWSSNPELPELYDNVTIDRPGIEVTVTHDTGIHQINGLNSHEALEITGGTLKVYGQSEISGSLLVTRGNMMVVGSSASMLVSGPTELLSANLYAVDGAIANFSNANSYSFSGSLNEFVSTIKADSGTLDLSNIESITSSSSGWLPLLIITALDGGLVNLNDAKHVRGAGFNVESIGVNSSIDLSSLELFHDDAQIQSSIKAFDGGTINFSSDNTKLINTELILNNNGFVNGGTLELEYEKTILTGSGSVNANILSTGGRIEPGDTLGVSNIGEIGQILIEGNFTENESSIINLELGGTLPNIDYDTLHINEKASINGILNVTLIDSSGSVFIPSCGDTFEIITATGGIDGTFVAVNLPVLGSGLSWNIYHLSNSVVLKVIEPINADFDIDGDVDGSDFLIWQTSFNYDDNGDADGDGDTDGNDFLIWQQEFGSGGGLLGSATVPEPASITLLITIAAFALARHRIRPY